VLHVAAQHGCLDIASLVLQHGADVAQLTNLKHAALHFACQYNHFKVCHVIFPLISVFMSGQVADLLLQFSAPVDPQDNNGNTPLHFCSSNGHLDAAQLLLAKGARVNLANTRGDTALHNAVRWGYVSLVEALVRAGADPSLANSKKRTPLQVWQVRLQFLAQLLLLQEAQSQEVLDLLLEATRDVIVDGRRMSTEVEVSGVSTTTCLFLNGHYSRIGELPENW
jgi:ankyrin repeat protein